MGKVIFPDGSLVSKDMEFPHRENEVAPVRNRRMVTPRPASLGSNWTHFRIVGQAFRPVSASYIRRCGVRRASMSNVLTNLASAI
ncbi:MAG: hypothetical protein KME26_12690 [Oscillatoria princeps RMCB-10]|nr:hypothetical protein [Oscillatoria princeps RMCB-10]